MNRKTMAWIAGLAFVVLIFFHMDFWRTQRTDLWFGWLPHEMGYRIVWMGFAWIYLMVLCRMFWNEERP
ncbi:hypothetical protein ABI59_09615 [Acidobacteria bacterium Mor1]|nr:hypothetical protein ABI59_09615 [Acidobacteria bacterium Mor1]